MAGAYTKLRSGSESGALLPNGAAPNEAVELEARSLWVHNARKPLCLGVGLLVLFGLFSCGAIQTITGAGRHNALLANGAGYPCPGSPASVHASCRVTAELHASCEDVLAEIKARVNGQYEKWHDPHNNGTYSKVEEKAKGVYELSRRTGDDKYTDKIGLELVPQGSDSCLLKGCSESQVFSVADFGTNYCNMLNLYCDPRSNAKCAAVTTGFASKELRVEPSIGATVSAAKCFTV